MLRQFQIIVLQEVINSRITPKPQMFFWRVEPSSMRKPKPTLRCHRRMEVKLLIASTVMHTMYTGPHEKVILKAHGTRKR
jgi:hypothetical protein